VRRNRQYLRETFAPDDGRRLDHCGWLKFLKETRHIKIWDELEIAAETNVEASAD
jgi:hypothetical protein